MKFGHGRTNKRWMVWMLLVAGAATALPGGSLLRAQSDSGKDATTQSNPEDASQTSSGSPPQSRESEPAPKEEDTRLLPPLSNPPHDLLKTGAEIKIGHPVNVADHGVLEADVRSLVGSAQELGMSKEAAEGYLLSLLPQASPQELAAIEQLGMEVEFVAHDDVHRLSSATGLQKIIYPNLYILGTKSYRDRVNSELQKLEDLGLKQVKVELQLLEVTDAHLQSLGLLAEPSSESTHQELSENTETVEVALQEFDLGTSQDEPRGPQPVVTSVKVFKDPNEKNSFIKRLIEDDLTSTLTSPRIVVMNGRQAEVFVGEEVPFTRPTSDSRDNVPEGWTNVATVDVVQVGIAAKICPTVDDDGTATISCEVSLTENLQVEKTRLANGEELETPTYSTREMAMAVKVASDSTIALMGTSPQSDTTLVAIIQCKELDKPLKGRSSQPAPTHTSSSDSRPAMAVPLPSLKAQRVTYPRPMPAAIPATSASAADHSSTATAVLAATRHATPTADQEPGGPAKLAWGDTVIEAGTMRVTDRTILLAKTVRLTSDNTKVNADRARIEIGKGVIRFEGNVKFETNSHVFTTNELELSNSEKEMWLPEMKK